MPRASIPAGFRKSPLKRPDNRRNIKPKSGAWCAAFLLGVRHASAGDCG
jgi:hypothetical protein